MEVFFLKIKEKRRKSIILLWVVVIMAILTVIVAEAKASSEDEENWIASLKDKWQGVELNIVATSFCIRPDIDEDFMELTGAIINPITVARADTYGKIMTTLSARSSEGMDIYLNDESIISIVIENNWYVPLQDMISESDKREILSSFIDPFTAKDSGDLTALPFLGMPCLLFYNETILREASYDAPPKNWDELRSMSMDLVDRGLVKYAITWPLWSGDLMSTETWALILNAMGGKYFNEDGTPAFNTDIGLKAMDYITDSIYVDKWASPTSTEVEKIEAIQPFLMGKNAFNLTWQFMWPMVIDPEQSNVVEDAKFAMVPYDEGATVSSWASFGAWTVNPYSKNIDAAKDYCRYVTSQAVAMPNFKGAGFLPMWKSFYKDPEAREIEPNLGIIVDAFNFSKVHPIDSWYVEAEEIIRVELSKAWAGAVSNKEALANAEDRLLKRISENWE